MGSCDSLNLALGADHGGFALKETLKSFLSSLNYQVQDFGAFSTDSSDYPDFARLVAQEVAAGIVPFGILICTTGIGMSIAANKVSGVRASLCHDPFSARLARLHNNANILCLGGGIVGPKLAQEIVQVWLTTPFSAEERHQRRLGKIHGLEGKIIAT